MSQHQQHRHPPQQGWRPEDVRAIVREGDYHTLVAVAEEVGEKLKRLSTSQLRNVFGEVRRLQRRYDANRLLMLRPRLAYMAARVSQKKEGKLLRDVLTKAIDEVFEGNADEQEQRRRFRRLVDFFEAIVAYHRAKGGRS